MKIYDHFNNNGMCVFFEGDCMELFNEIPDNTISLVVTSPPYNIGKSYEQRTDLDNYIDQQKAVIKQCYRVLERKGSICWQVGNYVKEREIVPLDITLYPFFSELGLKLRNRIVWHFGHGLHSSKRFSGRYEVILWFTKDDDYTFNLDDVRVPQKYPEKKHFKGEKKGEFSCNPLGKNPSDVWEIPNVKANHIEKTIHPCQFPIELVERLVLALTNKNDWVLDPFMGVGSTAIAALMHERRTVGSEILSDYVRVAKERVQKAEKGQLLIRPLERDVFDPTQKTRNIPPIAVSLFEKNKLF